MPSPKKPASAKAARKPARTRHRRTPAQLISDLKSQRAALASRMEQKLGALDQKIAKVEARYEKSIKLAELASVNAEDLTKQLEEAKRQQRLLRMALKAKR